MEANHCMSVKKALKAAIVGAGSRAMQYSSYSLERPDELKIVAVAEPDEYRRKNAADIFGIPASNCCRIVQELIEKRIDFDAVINGTMDREHVPTSLPLLQAGCDILLEKPICLTKAELFQIYNTAVKYDRKVMICHVLRYTPFYIEIKKRIMNGEIGDIVSIQTEENVSYHHMAAAFIRGKWNNSTICGSRMMMAKCCHDLDLITWLKSGVAPKFVTSFGGLKQYKPENAPEGSGMRCLSDCRIESTCPYSAKKHYMESGYWQKYAWNYIEHLGGNATDEIKRESLKNDNPLGRCVWHCDNNTEDHQTVMIEFEDGSTAVHTLFGGVPKPCRTIHIAGTTGEMVGVMEDGYLVIRHPDPGKDHEYSEEKIEINVSGDMHGGGDIRLIEDFVNTMKGQAPSISCTNLKDSIYGHLIGFAAEEAMSGRKVIEITNIRGD